MVFVTNFLLAFILILNLIFEEIRTHRTTLSDINMRLQIIFFFYLKPKQNPQNPTFIVILDHALSNTYHFLMCGTYVLCNYLVHTSCVVCFCWRGWCLYTVSFIIELRFHSTIQDRRITQLSTMGINTEYTYILYITYLWEEYWTLIFGAIYIWKMIIFVTLYLTNWKYLTSNYFDYVTIMC